MDTIKINPGDILQDTVRKNRYRILSVQNGECTMCQIGVNKLVIISHEIVTIRALIEDGTVSIIEDPPAVLDLSTLSTPALERYHTLLSAMNEVVKEYRNNFCQLCNKAKKPEIERITNQHHLKKSSFWNYIRKYLQSGMDPSSLIDGRTHCEKAPQYKQNTKGGRPSKYHEKLGVIRDDTVLSYFDEALENYKKGRHKTIKSAYEEMISKHYYVQELIEAGGVRFTIMPESERPTLRQFSYYLRKNLSAEEKDAIKTSIAEQRNNRRLLTGDSTSSAYGPGDLVEIDACEVDISLVSQLDNNQTIGRPVVYTMIDVYSRVILAVSVAFDNNSQAGVVNLFMNLAENKAAYCQQFGLLLDNPDVWPSGLIPNRIRCDRGSEFKSKEFQRICTELGITLENVTGASGSLKGLVEQSFRQLHLNQNEVVEGYGLIEKRYDSNHHKEATLTIFEYTKMVINFVLTHNGKYMKGYPMSKDMMKRSVSPVPNKLWEYGVKTYGTPRSIANKEQFYFSLLTPFKATLSRKGINFKGLWYIAEDNKALLHEMYLAQNKKVPIEVFVDPRNIGAVYYTIKHTPCRIPLNKGIAGNIDYDGMSLKELENFVSKKKEMDARGKLANERLELYSREVNKEILNSAKKRSPKEAKTKNMRAAREVEKQRVAKRSSIDAKLAKNQSSLPPSPKAEPLGEPREKPQHMTTFEEYYAQYDPDDL